MVVERSGDRSNLTDHWSLFSVEPYRLIVIPVAIVINEQFFPCFNIANGFYTDKLVIEIHLIFAIGAIGMIVQGYIT